MNQLWQPLWQKVVPGRQMTKFDYLVIELKVLSTVRWCQCFFSASKLQLQLVSLYILTVISQTPGLKISGDSLLDRAAFVSTEDGVRAFGRGSRPPTQPLTVVSQGRTMNASNCRRCRIHGAGLSVGTVRCASDPVLCICVGVTQEEVVLIQHHLRLP